MIKYSGNTINDWNYDESNINKVYYGVTSGTSYTQYEYVQGNGTSYFLTDYKPNANTSLELDIEGRTVEGISDYESHFFGSCYYDPDNGNAGSKRFKLVYFGTSALRYDYALNQITTSSSAINSRGIIKMNSTGGYLNGTKVVSYTNSLDMSDNQCPIAVFDTAWYNIRNGEVVMQSILLNGKRYRGKIYSVKIYEGNTLVRNFVPAIKDDVVGMYETITGVMYGSAVSTPFTVGGTSTEIDGTKGNVVYQKITTGDTPTPPTPKFEGKWVGYYSDSSVGYSADCDASTAITKSQVRQTDYTNFSKIIIGDCVTSVNEAFQRCSALTEVEIGSGVTTNLYYAFEWNLALTSVTWYATNLTDYQDGGFQQCQNLQRLIMHSTTCPEASITMFRGVPSTLIIYVPDDSISAYQNTYPWSDFTIKGLSEL